MTTDPCPIHIIADDREAGSGVIESLKSLALGDYELDGRLLFERKTQLQILQALPGIGPGTAGRLLERFGSVRAVLSASLEDLVGVPGIEAGRAEAIRWAMSETASAYPWDEAAL